MKKRVVLSAIWYPLCMASYFREALEQRDDIELITIGLFTGDWIPWNGGMHLPSKYVKPPTIPIYSQTINYPFIISPILYQNTYIDLLSDIDLFLGIDAGSYFYPKPKARIVAYVATDPHVLNYDRQREIADYFFCMQTPYMKSGDYYLPYAYSPRIHYPMDLPKEYDACLIGLHYQQRDELVQLLRTNGLKVFYDIGQVYDEYRAINNKSKIGLNWSSLLDMNARVWELAAMKLCSIENTVPDMQKFFKPEKDYLPFTDKYTAFQQVQRALRDESLRMDIANSAYETVKPHTYDARIEQIFNTVKLNG